MTDKVINKVRVLFSVIFLLLGLVGIGIVLKNYCFMFNMGPEMIPSHLFRFIWSLSSAVLGFAVLVFRIRYNPKPVFVSYLTFYLPLLIAIAALVTFVSILFDRLSGVTFFYFSFFLGFILGVLVDSFLNLVISSASRFWEK